MSYFTAKVDFGTPKGYLTSSNTGTIILKEGEYPNFEDALKSLQTAILPIAKLGYIGRITEMRRFPNIDSYVFQLQLDPVDGLVAFNTAQVYVTSENRTDEFKLALKQLEESVGEVIAKVWYIDELSFTL
ncbi:MAG: hypothetical protein ACRCXZ_00125 [Patescibacteria group bacterium]